MDGETLALFVATVLMILLLAGLSWAMKAAATGQIKRNAWVGIRTRALMHCDECWVLGHHAAAHKGTLGCWAAASILVLGGVVALLVPALQAYLPGAMLAAVIVMLGGVLLGVRDANTMLAKMHPGDR
ncbi:SdpI family protein [Paeniglutamicibacter sp. R2-26]|uniref:SdpI family protein n=1 Tax=Paeniglutamicibacter sp. R2-26 TaxID=3144417 RepID=UPI003EE79CC7